MGKANFPLINARRDIFNSWHLHGYMGDDAETVVVPTTPNEYGYHTVWLTEIPDGGSRIRIEGLTERTSNASSSTVAKDEFFVNYQTGEIFFNALQAGNEFKVEYYGRGSLVESDDINNLNERLTAVEQVSTDAIQNKLNDFSASITELNDQLTQFSSETIELKKFQEESNVKLEEHSERIISAFEKIDEMGPQIRDIKIDMEEQRGKLENVEGQVGQFEEIKNKVEVVEGLTAENQEKINSTIESINSANELISNNSNSISSINESVTGMNERLNELNNKVDNVETNISANAIAIQSNVRSIDEIGGKVNDLSTRMDETVVRLETAEGQVGSYNESISNLENQVTEAVNLTNELNEKVTAAISSVEGYDDKINNVETLVNEIKETSSGFDVSIESMQGQVNTIQDSFNSISEEVTNNTNKIEENSGLIATNTSSIEDISSRFENLESSVQDIDFGALAQISENIETINSNSAKISELESEFAANISNLDALISSNSEKIIVLEGTTSELRANLDVTNSSVDTNSTKINELEETISNLPIGDGALDTVTSDLLKVTGNMVVLVNRLESVESKLDSFRRTNIEAIVVDPEVNTVSEPDKDVIITGGDTVLDGGKYSVTGKSVEIKSLNVSNQATALKADTDVTIKGMRSDGELNKQATGINAQIQINADEYVTIRDSVFGQLGYNCVEVGLNDTAPKSVLIDNCQFLAGLNNNAISIFAWQDNAVITISNCYFADVSNVLRLSNRTNSTGTVINFVNCTVDKWESGSAYAGPIVCQDYTSGSEELERENNLFAPEKLTINFIGCKGPGMKEIDYSESSPVVYTGSGDENQLCYVYYNKTGLVEYTGDRHPLINFN